LPISAKFLNKEAKIKFIFDYKAVIEYSIENYLNKRYLVKEK